MIAFFESIGPLDSKLHPPAQPDPHPLIFRLFIGRWSVLQEKTVSRRNFFAQTVFSGMDSIVIVLFVNFFIGIVLAMQSAYQFGADGCGDLMWRRLSAVSMTREIGPVLTVARHRRARGRGHYAEISTMKVTEQIEALETISLNPVRYLVVPRFLGLVLMLACLVILARYYRHDRRLCVGVCN